MAAERIRIDLELTPGSDDDLIAWWRQAAESLPPDAIRALLRAGLAADADDINFVLIERIAALQAQIRHLTDLAEQQQTSLAEAHDTISHLTRQIDRLVRVTGQLAGAAAAPRSNPDEDTQPMDAASERRSNGDKGPDAKFRTRADKMRKAKW
ncbi:MAG: SlyX family protein [Chloroflexi bacterium]|nr:SlyX family protein [Chloroflexota bacterium]